jgi:hypothetical protein
MKTFSHLRQYLASSFLEWQVFETKAVEKNKTHISCLIFFFFESRAVYEIMSKNEVDPEGPQMTSQYGPYALYVG